MRASRPPALLLALALAGCGGGGGDEPGTTPSEGTSAAEPTERQEGATEDPQDAGSPGGSGRSGAGPADAGPSIPTGALCADLDLDAMAEVLDTGSVRVRSDVVPGDEAPLLGVEATTPQCTLAIGGGTAEFIVNELPPDRGLVDDVRRQVRSLTAVGALDCGKVADLTGDHGMPATFHSCRSPIAGVVAAYNVVMAEGWTLNCTVTRPQSPAEGRTTSEGSCALLGETLVD